MVWPVWPVDLVLVKFLHGSKACKISQVLFRHKGVFFFTNKCVPNLGFFFSCQYPQCVSAK